MRAASSKRSPQEQPADQCPGPTASPLSTDVGDLPRDSNAVAHLPPQALEVELIAESGRYDPEDTRWHEQVALLLRDVRREGAGVRIGPAAAQVPFEVSVASGAHEPTSSTRPSASSAAAPRVTGAIR